MLQLRAYVVLPVDEEGSPQTQEQQQLITSASQTFEVNAMSTIPTSVRDLLIQQIQSMMRKSSSRPKTPGPLGPPCSSFYLLQCEEAERPVEESRLSGVVGVWRITEDGSHELLADRWGQVTAGEVRGALYENAIVRFRIAPEGDKVFVSWTFGPLHGHGVISRIVRTAEGISLKDERTGWIS